MTTMMAKEYLRRMGRELNKGEASHDLSRFLSFGKEGVLARRERSDPRVPLFVGLAQRRRRSEYAGGRHPNGESC
jgi:hypothetical protein